QPVIDNNSCVAPPVQLPEQVPMLTEVNALLFQPSLWLKLYYRGLTVEFEGTGVLGKMDHGGVLLNPNEGLNRGTFRQFVWVLASELALYRDTFFLGFE